MFSLSFSARHIVNTSLEDLSITNPKERYKQGVCLRETERERRRFLLPTPEGNIVYLPTTC